MKQYQVTLHNGELAIREKNPYMNNIQLDEFRVKYNYWELDNSDRPYYILTGEHGLKEGDVVTGDRVEIVWQAFGKDHTSWSAVKKDTYDAHKIDFTEFTYYYNNAGIQTRQAARIKERVKEEKGKHMSVTDPIYAPPYDMEHFISPIINFERIYREQGAIDGTKLCGINCGCQSGDECHGEPALNLIKVIERIKQNIVEIPRWQLEHIEDTFRLVANVLNSKEKVSSLDRDVMQARERVKNALNGEADKIAKRT